MKITLRKYLLFCGAAAHLVAIVGLVVYLQFAEEREFGEIIGKLKTRYGNDHPTIVYAVVRALSTLGLPTRKSPRKIDLPPFFGPEQWPLHGVIPAGFSAQRYDARGIPIQSAAAARMPPLSSTAETIRVHDSKSLIAALKQAQAGDTVTLLPGKYVIRGRRVSLRNNGTPARPILMRAQRFGDATIELDTLEGFFVDKAHWVFENLRIRGVCKSDSRCEHAFHVFGAANGVSIRNNEITDFNAAVKVNGVRKNGKESFPDFGLIQNNSIYNTRPRNTSNPTTPLNINSGDGWVVSANFIADFSKGRGDRISYAAFMKGNSNGGVFERNLVVCHWRLPVDGDTRVGLSFGGGGTGARFCRGGNCDSEHTGGTMRNNIIARCPVDVGIYLNRATYTQIHNNLLIANTGIDVRFSSSTASIHNNVIDGRILDRDGGTHTTDNNLITSECGLLSRWLGDCAPGDWYAAPLTGDFHLNNGRGILGRGNSDTESADDFCGRSRVGETDIGPIEYPPAQTCLPGQAGN